MITMTYGIMPSREDFDSAMARMNSLREFNYSGFKFNNDSRVGTCVLTADQLWKELQEALTQWERGDSPQDKPVTDYINELEFTRAENAGHWCSCVLETLGFEWV